MFPEHTVTSIITQTGVLGLLLIGFGYVFYRLANRWMDAQDKHADRVFEVQRVFASRFIGAMEKQAAAMTDLVTSHKNGLDEQEKTRIAVQTLALKMEEMKAMMRQERCALVGEGVGQ